jgi:hypothetical protein
MALTDAVTPTAQCHGAGMEDDYRTVNRASWDEHVPAHAASPDYQLDRYAADPGAWV